MTNRRLTAGRRTWAWGLVLLSLWLTACEDLPTLTVSPTSVVIDDEGSTIPGPQLILGTVSPLNRNVFVAVLCSTEGLQGCTFEISSNQLKVSVLPKDPSEMAKGTYKDQVIIAVCTDDACKQHIEGSPAVVDVSYTVGDPFNVVPQQLAFSSVLGSSELPSPASVNLYGSLQFAWTASADSSWIHLPIQSGNTWYNRELRVGVDVSGLAVGHHSGTVTLTHAKTGDTHAIPVALDVVPPTLSTAPMSLEMGGADGTDLSSRKLSLSLNTGRTPHEWTATVDTGTGPQWLKLSKSSGMASATPSELTVSVDATGLHSGTYSGSVIFTAMVEGQPVSHTVSVSFTLAEHSIWAAGNGVALVSTPSASRLTEMVTLKDSWGLSTTPWTAQSNQPWLTVTPSGTTGQPLTLTAQPAGLASDTIHYATVTLSSSDGTVARAETIQVGLWVGSRADNSRDSVFEGQEVLEVDPIRPYAYAFNTSGTLSVYNIHTAALVTRLNGLASRLGAIAVSSDGSMLYVLDIDTHKVVPVDLRTLTAGTPWNTGLSTASSIHYVRPQGHGLLLIDGGQVFDEATGAALSQVTGGFSRGLEFGVANREGSLFCARAFFGSDAASCWGLRYSTLGGERVTLEHRGFVDGTSTSGKLTDVAISRDGSRIYGSMYAATGLVVYDGKTLQRLGLTQWTTSGNSYAVAVGPEGRVYGGIDLFNDPADLGVADSEGSLQGLYRMEDPGYVIEMHRLRVSGDGTRLVAISYRSGHILSFANVP